MSLISKQKINSNLTGSEQFFNSSNIKVFPCAYRGYWEEFTEHQKTDNFTRDGSSTSFELTFLPVKINSITGVEASSVYSIEGKTINFEVAPTASDTKIQVIYKYLSTELKSQGFDPEAQATTEYNLTNLYGKLSSNKESYIISFTNIGSNLYLLKCVIGGYYFEINNVTINDIKGKYLGIKLREFDLENSTQDTDRKSKVLESIIGDDYYLDVNADDEYAFTGLAVDSSNINYNYTLKVIKEDGTVNWQEKTILNVLDTGNGKYSVRSLNENVANNCSASGNYSTALGTKTEAKNDNSIALGNNTKTNMENQVVLGKFNAETDNAYLVVGSGTTSNRKNITEIKTNGTIETKGDITANGTSRTNKLTLGSSTSNNSSGAIDIYGTNKTKVFSVDSTGDTNITGNLTISEYFSAGNETLWVDPENEQVEINGVLKVSSDLSIAGGNITANKVRSKNTLTLGSNGNSSSGEILVYGEDTSSAAVFKVDNSGNLYLSGNIDMGGKITSRASITSTDGDNIVITKGYLDSVIADIQDQLDEKATSTDLGGTNDTLSELSDSISSDISTLSEAASSLSSQLQTAQSILEQLDSKLSNAVSDAVAQAGQNLTDAFSGKTNSNTTGTETGKYIISVSQTNGAVATTEGSFVSTVSSNESNTAPTSKAVHEFVSGSLGNYVPKSSLVSEVIDIIYPVGSIYMSASTSSTNCPLQYGEWTLIKSGKFLMAAGDNYDLGTEGGYKDAATISHDHKITIDNATPKDLTCTNSLQASYIDVRRINGETDANIIMGYGGSIAGDKVTYSNKPATVTGWDGKIGDHQRINFNLVHNHTISGGKHAHTGTIKTTGEDGINRNLPPYIAVYMWQRTK